MELSDTSLRDYAAAPREGESQPVELIHGRIRQAILSGEISPGEELSQVRLARHLGVSRTPLREALRMLVHEGLVESAHGRQMRVVGFSVQDMEQLYVQRVALEGMGIRISVPRLTSQDVAAMEGAYAQTLEASGRDDYEAWKVPHRELHRRFVAYSGSRMLTLITQLSEHAERYRRLYATRAARAYQRADEDHRRIVEACRDGDASAAAQALAEHLGHTALGVIELIEPDFRATALRTAVLAAGASAPAPKREDGTATAGRAR